jgi:hypothetical protein
MNDVGVLLGSFVLLGLIVDWAIRRVAKAARRFPWCKDCGRNMKSEPLPKALPYEILRYLDRYQIPAALISRFLCPNRHYQLWFIPKLGNTERAFFLKEEL